MNKSIELLGRLLISAIFLMAGLSKIGAYAGTQAYMESKGVPGMLLPLVIALEVLAPIMIIIGWKARYAALALAIFSVASAVLFHLEPENQMQMAMFMKNMAIAGGLLFIYIHGTGALGLDARSGKD